MRTPSNDSGEDRKLIRSVLETLEQGELLLARLNNETYTRKIPATFNASIGSHYRHCLDHFRSLLDAAVHGDLNYDHRERGTLIENDRFAAANATWELREGFVLLDPALLSRPLTVTCKTSYAASGSQSAASTIGREIMYSVAHAVHHYAVIGIMGGILGLNLPDGFGVAPSTLKYQAETSTAAA